MIWSFVTPQTIAVGESLAFEGKGNCAITHINNSSLFTLHKGTYEISFGANVTGATADTELDLALSINGEPLLYTNMAYTPATANAFGNVSRCITIDVPCNCCFNLSVKNIGTTAMTVSDATLSIRKEN